MPAEQNVNAKGADPPSPPSVTRAPPALAQGYSPYSLAAMKPSALILNDTPDQPALNASPLPPLVL